MKILIPLAGRASRFREMGYEIPKPLIPILGEPMVKWALKNLDVPPEKLYFFILEEHISKFNLDEQLKGYFSKRINIVPVKEITSGAPLTLLLIEDLINNEEDILIVNGDQYFEGDVLGFIKELGQDYSGLIPVFESNQQKFSYAKVDSEMNVLETAEKVPISNFATIGIYYFRKGLDFVKASKDAIKKDLRRGNEFFVCPLYNQLIAEGKKFKAIKLENWPLGTPEDVDKFKKYYKGEFK